MILACRPRESLFSGKFSSGGLILFEINWQRRMIEFLCRLHSKVVIGIDRRHQTEFKTLLKKWWAFQKYLF